MRRGGLTGRGIGFCAAGLGVVALAAVAGQPDLVWPGVFLTVVPLLCLLLLVVARPRFAVERTLQPPSVQVDDPVTIDLAVTSLSAVGSPPALVTDTPPRPVGAAHRFMVPSLRTGRGVRESYSRRPRRRGRWELDGLAYEQTDVLGMARRTARVPAPATLLVTPRVVPLEPGRGAASGGHGETPIPLAAVSGPDDVLVREYLPRDDVRRIHWPSTARTGTLMVRREEQSWDPSAWLVLDSRVAAHPARGEESPTFEWLLSAAASIGTALLADGFEVGVADAAGRVHSTSVQRRSGAIAGLLEHLTDADLTDTGSLRLGAGAVARAPSRHLVVALLGRLDPETAEHLVGLHETGQECRAIATGQPGAERAFEAGRSVLLAHGWSVVTCGVGGDLAAAWATLARAGARR